MLPSKSAPQANLYQPSQSQPHHSEQDGKSSWIREVVVVLIAFQEKEQLHLTISAEGQAKQKRPLLRSFLSLVSPAAAAPPAATTQESAAAAILASMTGYIIHAASEATCCCCHSTTA